MDQKIKDLNLLLLVLSGWEEESRQVPGEKIMRSWKGYLFEVLNELEEDKLIQQFKNTKSVIITPEGLRKAREVRERLGGNGGNGKSQSSRPEMDHGPRW
jgi:hypothetical protein